jgi:hypothetical protein
VPFDPDLGLDVLQAARERGQKIDNDVTVEGINTFMVRVLHEIPEGSTVIWAYFNDGSKSPPGVGYGEELLLPSHIAAWSLMAESRDLSLLVELANCHGKAICSALERAALWRPSNTVVITWDMADSGFAFLTRLVLVRCVVDGNEVWKAGHLGVLGVREELYVLVHEKGRLGKVSEFVEKIRVLETGATNVAFIGNGGLSMDGFYPKRPEALADPAMKRWLECMVPANLPSTLVDGRAGADGDLELWLVAKNQVGMFSKGILPHDAVPTGSPSGHGGVADMQSPRSGEDPKPNPKQRPLPSPRLLWAIRQVECELREQWEALPRLGSRPEKVFVTRWNAFFDWALEELHMLPSQQLCLSSFAVEAGEDFFAEVQRRVLEKLNR